MADGEVDIGDRFVKIANHQLYKNAALSDSLFLNDSDSTIAMNRRLVESYRYIT
jgi:hypothetical protein